MDGSRRQIVSAPVVESLRRRISRAGGAPLAGDGEILVAVNTDPHHAQETMVHVPIDEMGIDDDEPYVVHDLLTGARYTWRGVAKLRAARSRRAAGPRRVELLIERMRPLTRTRSTVSAAVNQPQESLTTTADSQSRA